MNPPEPLPDFHLIQVFQAVAESGSFTGAGEQLGLTQSAVTRQIQHLEEVIGTSLFHRTTRSVRLTEAGSSFLITATHILREFDQSMDKFREIYLNQAPQVRLALSHSIAHSHLPGLLVHFRRTNPNTRILITYESSSNLSEQLLDHEIDVAIFAQPSKPPSRLCLLHSFNDDFVIITPPEKTKQSKTDPNYSWLALDQNSTTGALINHWISKLQPDLKSSTEFNNFDLIINLVALGLGSSIVPRRAVRPYARRFQINQIEPKTPLHRMIGVYSRKSSTLNHTIDQFVESILFGWKSPPPCNAKPSPAKSANFKESSDEH